jgi:hypothetical protein
MRLSANTKRVLLAGLAMLVLLTAGLLIARAGGGNSDGDLVPMDSPTPSPPATEDSPSPATPEQAVEEAYLRQWDVYAQAVETLDTTGLDEVLTGDALRAVRREIRDLRREGLRVRVRVKHDLRIRIADAGTAVVIDRYENHSVEFDQETGKPTERDPKELILEAYTLKKLDGAWKVSAIDRQSVRRLGR